MPNFSDWFGEIAELETASLAGLSNVLLIAMAIAVVGWIGVTFAKRVKEPAFWQLVFMLPVFAGLLATVAIAVLMLSLITIGWAGLG